MNLAHIITRPIITEKSLTHASKGIFTFEVKPTATKSQISEAVQQAFQVSVTKVSTTSIPTKAYRTSKKRLLKHRPASKKACVQLKAGQKIDLFEIETK